MTWWWVLVIALSTAGPIEPAEGCGSELARLDQARAAAFAAADPAALGGVYVSSSPLLEADADTIEAYSARGGRVVGALLQISACEVLERSADAIRLEVVDVMGPAYVRWDDATRSILPRDRATRRWITLRHTADGWRISGSRPPGPPAGQTPRS